MQPLETNIAIIGGGLTGLTLAYLLRGEGLSVTVIEAGDRLGGRIHTLRRKNVPPQEMGATWLGKKHTALLSLLKEIDIEIFEQKFGERAIYEPISTSPPQLVQLPPNNDPSFRVKGGTSSIIERLIAKKNKTEIFTNQKVKAIKKNEHQLLVRSTDYQFKTDVIVSTLPPHLFLKTIQVGPGLPEQLIEVMSKTHTWMGESIKVALAYEQPFWRANKLSGTIFSSVGPVPEMYDHSNFEDNKYALAGFLNGAFFTLTKGERLDMVLRQLRKYYGDKIDNYLTYEEAVWRHEPLTFAAYGAHVLPHQFNGHAVYQKPYLNSKLFIAGAETAQQHPGYMDGAVRSAMQVAAKIKELY